jgi:rod shape-determining protein MreD
MIRFEKRSFIYKLYTWLPLLTLYVSVLNEFDFNYLNIDYFSFNFPFILIFYFTLKEYNKFDYLLVFVAGLINDVVVGLPLGISSFSYTMLSIFASYLRNITIRPHLIKDWFYFLFVISLINSINYSVLFLFFSYDLDITFYVINNLFTFLLYVPISLILNYYFKAINDSK